jgi:hypothetical protein
MAPLLIDPAQFGNLEFRFRVPPNFVIDHGEALSTEPEVPPRLA